MAAANERVEKFFAYVGSVVSRTYTAAMADGHLAAAGRQGIDEIGMALKAFPDGIQADEPGTLWNPTQGEIAQNRRPDIPSPSEIIKQTRLEQMKQPKPDLDQSQDQDHGRE